MIRKTGPGLLGDHGRVIDELDLAVKGGGFRPEMDPAQGEPRAWKREANPADPCLPRGAGPRSWKPHHGNGGGLQILRGVELAALSLDLPIFVGVAPVLRVERLRDQNPYDVPGHGPWRLNRPRPAREILDRRAPGFKAEAGSGGRGARSPDRARLGGPLPRRELAGGAETASHRHRSGRSGPAFRPGTPGRSGGAVPPAASLDNP